VTADAYPPQLANGSTGIRAAGLSPAGRRLHRAILTRFATTGRVPDPTALTDAASPKDVSVLLSELHDHDVVRLDHRGRIRAAYPFSGVPTAHRVAIDSGPSVYAMCAVDALGMAAMLGRGVTISSTDPASGAPIRVTIREGHAIWQPDTAVVVVGTDHDAAAASGADGEAGGRSCPVPSADRCCGVLNFFAGPAAAEAWIGRHPQVAGVVLTQPQALRLGVDIFGDLLHGPHPDTPRSTP
jgi:hypothetical protein